MYHQGYIYIPHTCKRGESCRTLIFLHGEGNDPEYWRDIQPRRTGLLEYAATNNLIVVFPQNDDTVMLSPWASVQAPQPYGWSAIHTKDPNHPQIQTLRNIFNSLILGTDHAHLLGMSQSEVSSAA